MCIADSESAAKENNKPRTCYFMTLVKDRIYCAFGISQILHMAQRNSCLSETAVPVHYDDSHSKLQTIHGSVRTMRS